MSAAFGGMSKGAANIISQVGILLGLGDRYVNTHQIQDEGRRRNIECRDGRSIGMD